MEKRAEDVKEASVSHRWPKNRFSKNTHLALRSFLILILLTSSSPTVVARIKDEGEADMADLGRRVEVFWPPENGDNQQGGQW